MYKHAACLIMLFVMTYHLALGQMILPPRDPGNIPSAIPSPTSASLGKFGLTPIDYYTGIPKVTIPLWEIKSSQLEMSLSLNYNNNGLKVTEEASWVGLGWTLSAGGVITQSIRGMPDHDEYVTPYSSFNHTETVAQKQVKLNRVAQGTLDGSPDFYIFNFDGHYGRFYIYQGKVYQFTYSDLIIEHSSSDNYFTITTGEGSVYKFSKIENNETYTYNDEKTVRTYTWLLTEVASADQKDKITLSYVAQPEVTITPNGMRADYTWQGYVNDAGKQECMMRNPAIKFVQNFSKNTFTSYRLERIESQYERIDFIGGSQDRSDLNGNARALREIRIYNRNNLINPVKSWIFNTGYFGHSLTPEVARLRLNSVVESGSNGLAKPAYGFNYYDNERYYPSKLQFQIDHWGYFGNNTLNGTPIPTTLHQSEGTANREPNFERGLTTVLQKVTYPTGGSEEFVYEPNEYNDGTTLKVGPGVRVKQIITTNRSKKSYRKFEYVPPVNSWISPQYELVAEVNPNTDQTCTLVIVAGNNPDIYSIFASTVYYPQVVEFEGINGENGKTVFNYSPIGNPLWSNGMNLTKKTVYTRSNVKVKEEEYRYQDVVDNTLSVVFHTRLLKNSYASGCVTSTCHETIACTLRHRYSDCQPLSNPRNFYSNDDDGTELATYAYSYQTLTSFWNSLYKKEERVYNQADDQKYSNATTYYYYDKSNISSTDPTFHRYLTREQVTTSAGDAKVYNTKYALEYNTSVGTYGLDVYFNALKKMRELHIANSIVEKSIGFQKAGSTAWYLLSAELYLYKSYLSTSSINMSNILQLHHTVPSISTTLSTINGNAFTWSPLFKPKAEYFHNADGFPLTIQRSDDVSLSYQWASTHPWPIATFSNASRVLPFLTQPAFGNEASCTSFETGVASPSPIADEDYWSINGTAASYPVQDSHTGRFSWQVGSGRNNVVYGPTHTFIPARQHQRYKLSAWVKTTSDFGNGGGHLVMSVNRANGTYINVSDSYQNTYFSNTGNVWKYVEVILDLGVVHQNSNIGVSDEKFQVIAYCYNDGGVPFLIDDIRFQPVESTATTYTYDVGNSQPTSVSKSDSRPQYYEYDEMQRLKIVRDAQGNIVQHQEYHYRQP